MKDELNEKDTPTRGPGRSRQLNSKETDEKQPSENEDPEREYFGKVKKWSDQERSNRNSISSKEAWDEKKKEFANWIAITSPFFFLASLLCLVPEYYVWKVHFNQWQEIENFEPSFMTLNALLAFGTVAGMAVSWHAVIACWQNKCRTDRIGRGLLIVTVIVLAIFLFLFLFESVSFYEFMRRPKQGPFDLIPGKSHKEALIKIGSWGSLNFIFGFITGFCTSHIIRKE